MNARRTLCLALGMAALTACTGPTPTPYVEVEYRRSGGFAPMGDELHVWSDGRLVARGPLPQFAEEVWTVPVQELNRLRAIVRSPAFRALGPSYVPADICCDRPFVSIEVIRDGHRQRVITLAGATNPAVLDHAFDEVGRLQSLSPREPGTIVEDPASR